MQVYKVGGFVRDTLLGKTPKDTDYVVVGATPEQMLEAGFKQVGADFPVFLHPETGDEYALARTERKTGRGYNGFETDHRPTVTLEQDLERRDLTINAMAMDADGNVIDPFDGQEDLRDKVLCHIGPAFADDPVRVLRLARFHARYGPEWEIAPATMYFCRKMVEDGELDYLTKERVVAELLKALAEPHPSLFFEMLHACGALDVVFPEFDPMFAGENSMVTPYKDFDRIPNTMFSYFVMSMMVYARGMEERLVIPSDFVKYAKVARTMHQGWYSEEPIHVLYRMDAYRQRDLFERVSRDFKQCGFISAPAKKLIEAFELTKDVKLADLPDAERLKKVGGPIIATAIRNERERIYHESHKWFS